MKIKEHNFKEGDLVPRKVMSNTKDMIFGVLRPTWEGPCKLARVV